MNMRLKIKKTHRTIHSKMWRQDKHNDGRMISNTGVKLTSKSSEPNNAAMYETVYIQGIENS